jgi:hypothetical protein
MATHHYHLSQADGFGGDPGDEDDFRGDDDALSQEEIMLGSEFLREYNELINTLDLVSRNGIWHVPIVEYTLGDIDETRLIPLLEIQKHFRIAANMINQMDKSIMRLTKQNNTLSLALTNAVRDNYETSRTSEADYVLEAITELDGEME